MVTSWLAAPCGLSAQEDTTFVAGGNPLVKYKYTADPGAMVHDGRLYIYAGHDECPPTAEHYLLNEWCVFSSSDLKTWTEHPVPLRAKDFVWAKGEAWASQVIERDGKFYWYVTVEHATIPGKSIGVAVSDSPTGPFVDARGSALITNDMTTERSKSYWDDIHDRAGRPHRARRSAPLHRSSLAAQAGRLVLPVVCLGVSRENLLCHEPQHHRPLAVQRHPERAGGQLQHQPSGHHRVRWAVVLHLSQRRHQPHGQQLSPFGVHRPPRLQRRRHPKACADDDRRHLVGNKLRAKKAVSEKIKRKKGGEGI